MASPRGSTCWIRRWRVIRHAVGEVELGSDAHWLNVGDADLNILDDNPDFVTDYTDLHLTSVSPARGAALAPDRVE